MCFTILCDLLTPDEYQSVRNGHRVMIYTHTQQSHILVLLCVILLHFLGTARILWWLYSFTFTANSLLAGASIGGGLDISCPDTLHQITTPLPHVVQPLSYLSYYPYLWEMGRISRFS